jgi:hypothetical protein
MKLNPQELEKIASLTLDHYNERAEDFWQGTRDHDVKQNIAALFQWIEGKPPFTILDFGCGPGRDLLDACAMCQTGSPKHQNHRPLHWRQIMTAAQFSPVWPKN